jgi:hypoxanthine phosphoribosyltransferase
MTIRVFDHTHLWRLSDSALDQAVTLLATAAATDFGRFASVIGVAEGGRIPATRIAAQLGIPIAIVRARHNPTDATYTPASGNVWCDPDGLAPAGQVLVVDDICGSGATLRTVVTALTERSAPGARLVTATLCRNAGAATTPDLWVWDDLRDWVVFPWETQPPTGPTADLPMPTRARRR